MTSPANETSAALPTPITVDMWSVPEGRAYFTNITTPAGHYAHAFVPVGTPGYPKGLLLVQRNNTTVEQDPAEVMLAARRVLREHAA